MIANQIEQGELPGVVSGCLVLDMEDGPETFGLGDRASVSDSHFLVCRAAQILQQNYLFRPLD